MFPRVALAVCGTFNALAFVLFTFYPKEAVEGYGVGTPNLETDAGQVILFLTEACGAVCLGFAILLLHPLVYGASHDVVQLALLSYGAAAMMATVLALGTPWPDETNPTAEIIFIVQNAILALLPLTAYSRVPKMGYSNNKILHDPDELLTASWWLCNSNSAAAALDVGGSPPPAGKKLHYAY